MTSPLRHRALAGPARARILALLRAAPGPLDIRELAEGVGLHPNTVRDHLQRLLDAGLVQREVAPPAGRGRPRLRFVADADSADDDPAPYRALARVLAERLAAEPDAAGSATAAGEEWGRSLAASMPPASTPAESVERIVTLLDDAGFAPELPARVGDPLPLRRCPFGTLAVGREPVICGVHLGLMRGALAALEAPLEATALEPFVRPDLCLAHFEPRADG
jgi:predicted ArsR family transcriptional regulator